MGIEMHLRLVICVSVVLVSQSSDGHTVRARSLTWIVDATTTWTTAHSKCKEQHGSTLATMDKHLTAFLHTQTSAPLFRRNVKNDFWIGLHDKDLPNQSKSLAGYQWVDRCVTLSDWSNWEHREPSDTDEAFCVYAKHDTFQWATDKCDAFHGFLCQTETQCDWHSADDACELFSKAVSKTTYTTRTPHEDCYKHCETTLKNSSPCWGFIASNSYCTLFYQPTQPSCHNVSVDQTTGKSWRVVRTCFRMFYINGPIYKEPVNESVPHSRCPLKTPKVREEGPATAISVPSAPSAAASSGTTQTSTAHSVTTVATATTEKSDPSSFGQETTEGTSTRSPSLEDYLSTGYDVTSVPETTPPEPEATEGQRQTSSAVQVKVTSIIFKRPATKLPKLPRCVCVRDVKPPPNVTSAALTAARETRRLLAVDKKTLSKTRRKRSSAVDNRPSARGMTYCGAVLVTLTLCLIVLPDINKIFRHLRHGPSHYDYTSTTRRKSLKFVKVS